MIFEDITKPPWHFIVLIIKYNSGLRNAMAVFIFAYGQLKVPSSQGSRSFLYLNLLFLGIFLEYKMKLIYLGLFILIKITSRGFEQLYCSFYL